MYFYIVCKRHMHRKDHAVLFWGPNHCGYFYDLNKAGKYTEEESKTFKPTHYSDDMPVLCEVVDAEAELSVIDRSSLGRICKHTKKTRELLKIKLTELHSGNTAWDYRAFCTPKQFTQINKNTRRLLTEIESILGDVEYAIHV